MKTQTSIVTPAAKATPDPVRARREIAKHADCPSKFGLSGAPSRLARSALLVLAFGGGASPLSAKPDGDAVPLAYRLDLTVVPERPRFTGHVEIDVRLDRPTKSLSIDGQGLTVTRSVLRTNGAEIEAQYRETDARGHAQIGLGRTVPAGRATLVLDYSAAFNDAPEGLYHAAVGDRWYVWSQLETNSARKVLPSFDRPGVKTPFTISVATTQGLAAASNAAETAVQPDGMLVRHQFATTAPLPTYLLAIAVGPFAISSGLIAGDRERAHPLPLRILSTQGGGSADLAIKETGPILTTLETYMGRPYPYAKLDQIGSPLMIGAMENAGAIIYSQETLLPDEPGTSASQGEFVRDVSHELAHQWFGDLVTPKSWDDLWLNESFANWMSYRIGDRWRPDLKIGTRLTQEAIDAFDLDELAASHPVHEQGPGEGTTFFDAITYGKGAQVLAMFEAYMGEAKFRAGLQLYLRRFANANARSNDFFDALASTVHDQSVLTALHSFVDQPGVPLIRFMRVPGGYRLSQTRYVALGDQAPAEKWSIPVCFRAETLRGCSLLNGPDASITVSAAKVFMPNADGLGYYRFALPAQDWRALIATSADLSPAEAMMTTDSLWAGFHAGEIDPAMLIDAARHMADNRFGPAAIDAGDRFALLRHQGLVSPYGRARYNDLLDRLYRPLLDRAGFSPTARSSPKETPESQRFRIGLERLLADEAEDPTVLAGLSLAAEKVLSGQSRALAPQLLVTGFAAYLSTEPSTRIPDLFGRLATSKDGNQREIFAYALGSHRTIADAGWLFGQLSDDRLTSIDRQHLLFTLAEEPATRVAAMSWAVGHLDLFSRQSVPDLVIRLAENSCTVESERQWNAAIGPRVAGNANATHTLAITLEKVRNCVALRARRGNDVIAALG